MKKFVRIFCAALACAVIGCVMSLSVFAANSVYKVEELNMSIPVPNDMLVVTRSTTKSDSFFSEFGLDYGETMDNLKSGNIYLQAVRDDSELTLTVTMTKTAESEKIGDYNKLSDDELTGIKEALLSDKSYKSASFTDSNNVKYINLSMSYKVEKETVRAQQYNTVFNGENINITLQSAPGSKLKKADIENFESIIADTVIEPEGFFSAHKDLIIYGAVTLVGIILVVMVIIIVVRIRRGRPARRHNNLVHEMAHERRISETTQIPRQKVNPAAEQTQSFLTNYAPVEEIGKHAKTKKKSRAAAEAVEQAKTVSEPVPEEAKAAPEAEVISKPETAEALVAAEIPAGDIAPETLEIPEASAEPEITEAAAQSVEEAFPDMDEVFDSPVEEEAVETAEPEATEAEAVEEVADEVPEAAMLAFESAEGIEVFDEGFEESAESFDEAENTEFNSEYGNEYNSDYEEDETDEYVRERRSRPITAAKVGEVVKKVFAAIGKVLLIIGKGIFTAFKYLFLGIWYIITHIRYFCINLYRMIKRNRAKKKRIKAEEQRRREASERRRAQREAERARQQRNAQRRDSNDLVKVHSSGERRRAPQQQTRSSASRTAYPSRRSSNDRRR